MSTPSNQQQQAYPPPPPPPQGKSGRGLGKLLMGVALGNGTAGQQQMIALTNAAFEAVSSPQP